MRRLPALARLIPLVALAGAAGALLRLLMGEFFPEQGMKFPWTTLAVNVAGSAALGLVVGVVSARPRVPGWVLPVLGTGLLGSFTTFSSVILAVMPSTPGGIFEGLSAATYVSPGAVEMFSYLMISIIGCTAAAAGGLTVGRSAFGCVDHACVDHTCEEGRV